MPTPNKPSPPKENFNPKESSEDLIDICVNLIKYLEKTRPPKSPREISKEQQVLFAAIEVAKDIRNDCKTSK